MIANTFFHSIDDENIFYFFLLVSLPHCIGQTISACVETRMYVEENHKLFIHIRVSTNEETYDIEFYLYGYLFRDRDIKEKV